MISAPPPTPPPSRLLAALIGFIVLFAAVTAGYTLMAAGQAKWQDPAWTGDRAGAAITGFLKGADQKAIRTDRNPYPDVLPPVQHLNDRLFAAHAPLVAWLVTLGEMLLPIGVVILLCLRFPGSRAITLALSALAASLNFLYMLEGSSGSNPWLVFMWLSVLWLLATFPQAALFYAIDVRRVGRRGTERLPTVENTTDRWVFFVGVFVLIAIGDGMLYPPPVLLGLLGFTLLIAGVLCGIQARARRPLLAPQAMRPADATRTPM